MAAPSIALCAALAALRVAAPLSDRVANYTIDARLDVDKHTITGHETLRWHNRGTRATDRLVVHLYMNAFSSDTTRFARESGGAHRANAGSPSERGEITVQKITVSGQAAALAVDETLGTVTLPRPVGPGQTVEVTFDFVTTLPRVWARTGFVDGFVAGGQWFPKVAVWDCPPLPGCQFRAAQLHANSEFFSDFGVYDVSLDAPTGWQIAATGVGVDERTTGDRTVHRFHAEDVHDFAWFASPHFHRYEASAHDARGEVKIVVFAGQGTDASAPAHLDAAVRGLEALATRLRPYPYAQLSVVIPPLDGAGAGGMEYPTLITGFHSPSPHWLHLPELVTLHELAHQYFYGLVATDEPEAAWLDEGVAEYTGSRLLDELYGGVLTLGGWTVPLLPIHWVTYTRSAVRYRIDLPSYAYVSMAAYGATTYSKMATALLAYQNRVGTAAFDERLRAYVETQSFHHPGRREFVGALAATDAERAWWDTVLTLDEPLDYALADAACGNRECTLTVERAGPPLGPITVRVVDPAGTTARYTWPLTEQVGRARFAFTVDEKTFAEASLELGAQALLDTNLGNDRLRRIGTPKTAGLLANAAALVASLLLALVGP